MSVEVLGQSAVPSGRTIWQVECPLELRVDMVTAEHGQLCVASCREDDVQVVIVLHLDFYRDHGDIEVLEGKDPEDLRFRSFRINRHVVDPRRPPQPIGRKDVLQRAAFCGEGRSGAIAADEHRSAAVVLLNIGLDGVFLEGHLHVAGPAKDAVRNQLAALAIGAKVWGPIRIGLCTQPPPAQATLEEEGVREMDGVEGSDVDEYTLAGFLCLPW
mmetsp:Transcript_96643/g.207364  ORF Transcript_96643/g.207364 Transcript_96643/m.207364 type:complete len:215 (-) Transcript_96643:754-1398(-)